MPWTRRTVVPTTHVCPKCRVEKPRTEAFFYFAQRPERRGQITGFCRPCQQAYCRDWHASHVRALHYHRDWRRRREAIPPERWRQRMDDPDPQRRRYTPGEADP